MKRLLYLLVIAVLSANHLLAQPAYSDTIDWEGDGFDDEWIELSNDDLWDPDLFKTGCDAYLGILEQEHNHAQRRFEERNYNKTIDYYSLIIDYFSYYPYWNYCDSMTTNKARELFLIALYYRGCISISYIDNQYKQGLQDLALFCYWFNKWSNSFMGSDTMLEMMRDASLILSKYYKDTAETILQTNPRIRNYIINNNSSDTLFDEDTTFAKEIMIYIDNLNLVTYYYDQANVSFHSELDIINTDFIEWVYLALGKSTLLHKREVCIGEYFFLHPHHLYPDFVNIIENPYADSTDTIPDTIPYSIYPIFWLNNNGYYGKECAIQYQQLLNKISDGEKGKAYLKTLDIDIDSYNGVLYYLREEYQKAIWYYNRSYSRGKDPSELMMRGICRERLSNNYPPGEKKDELKELALDDYKEALKQNELDNSSKSFIYARLGLKKEAIRLAQQDCREHDSILLTKDSCSSDDTINACIAHLHMAQIYCMFNQTRKAKKSIKKALSINHEPYIFSIAVYLPFIESVTSVIEKYAAEEGLKKIEFDTIFTFLEYRTKESVMEVTCTINGITVDSMVFDSGAGVVFISRVLADAMLQNGTISHEDYLGYMFCGDANGISTLKQCVNLRSIKIGDIELLNVTACINDSPNAPLLLGQSALSNFIVEMNPQDHLLTLKQIKYKR